MVVALRREEGRAVNFLLVGTDFPPLIGGISTYAKELAIALSRRGSVTVLAPGARNFKYYDSDYPFRVIRTPAFPLLRDIAFLIYLIFFLFQVNLFYNHSEIYLKNCTNFEVIKVRALHE